jgi:hypothetical protein
MKSILKVFAGLGLVVLLASPAAAQPYNTPISKGEPTNVDPLLADLVVGGGVCACAQRSSTTGYYVNECNGAGAAQCANRRCYPVLLSNADCSPHYTGDYCGCGKFHLGNEQFDPYIPEASCTGPGVRPWKKQREGDTAAGGTKILSCIWHAF